MLKCLFCPRGNCMYRRNCFRNYNHNNMLLNAPKKKNNVSMIDNSKLKEKQVVVPQRNILMKHQTMGGFSIPNNTMVGSEYHIAFIHLDVSKFRNYKIELNFGCNISTTKSDCFLSFQVLKQWDGQIVPVPSSSYMFFAKAGGSCGADTFSLDFIDCDALMCNSCSYSIYLTVLGMPTCGNVLLTNIALMATVIE